jgi:Phage portal protein/Family of unknown function (DUF5872)
VDKKAIARALKTKATQAPITQGAPSGVTGLPPLAAYGAWNYGMAPGGALPRPNDVFTSGAFSPLNPIAPVGIDQPQPDTGRPMPRRMQYPVGWNMPIGQPGTEGLKLVSFANLRAYADAYSVVRACIQVRKEEILGLDWDIVPTDEAQRKMRGDVDAHQEFQNRRKEVLDFFRRPDPNYHDFVGWLGAVLEDVFVVDALSIYLHPSRVKGKGLLGSDLAALEVLDGTTIRPLLDIRGGSPAPPAPAYQQYLWGVPRTDLMDIILESDIEGMDEPVAEYRGDQLLYLPYTRRSWTPYGFPGIERAIIPVMTGLRRQQYQLEYFSEGSIPGKFIVPGEDISTPAQIRQLQDTLNAIAGDQAWKHKIIVLPRGSKTEDQKQIELASKFDEQLVTSICMAYDVMPMELGIMQGSDGQSPNQTNMVAAASEEINKRKALKPMIQWLKSAVFDHILQDICQQDDMQWAWVGLESASDEEAKAANYKTLTGIGLMSIDEARVDMGLSPWGLPLTSDPVYMSATGVSTLGTVDPATAEAYFNEAPIVQHAATANSSQPMGQPVPTGEGGAAAAPTVPGAGPASASTNQGAQPNASVGFSDARGRPKGGRGGAPSVQPPAAGSSTPLHGNDNSKKKDKAVTKAVANEFDALRRHIKKGRDVTVWEPEFISNDALVVVAKSVERGLDPSQAIARGKQVMKASERISRRKGAINEAATNVVNTLGSLASSINNAKVGPINFIDQGTQALHNGYIQVMNAGAQHASQDMPNVSPVIPVDITSIAAERAANQRDFLTGMAQDVMSGQSDAQINQRLNLYARSLLPAYEQGYGLAALSGQAIGNEANYTDIPADTSITPEDQPDRSNGITALEVLGGLAGIGAVASTLFDNNGDPVDGYNDPSTGVVDNVGDTSLDTGSSTYDQAPPSVIIWHATSPEPCDHCADRDGQEYTMDTLPCWPGDGGFGEFCDGAANCNCYLEYKEGDDSTEAYNPFKDLANDFYQQRLAEENYYDQTAIDNRNADIAAVAQDDPAAAMRMQQRDALYGVPGTRYGPDGLYDPSGPRYASDTGNDTGVDQTIDDTSGDVTASIESELHKLGNADSLINWYNSGADGQINWGEPGDFDACVAVASKYMDEDQAKGFCNLRHQDAVGGPPGSEDKTTKSKYDDVIGERNGEPVDQDLYNKVIEEAKRKFDVYPSAYANGWVVQEYKRRGGKYRTTVTKEASDTFSPPEGVRAEAKRALEWIKEGHAGDGFTDVGRKRASDLAAGHAISLDTIKRMVSFFARHEVDKQGNGWSQGSDGYPSPGRVAWAAWGGDAGWSWAKNIIDQHDKSEKVTKFNPDQERDFHGRFTAEGLGGGSSFESAGGSIEHVGFDGYREIGDQLTGLKQNLEEASPDGKLDLRDAAAFRMMKQAVSDYSQDGGILLVARVGGDIAGVAHVKEDGNQMEVKYMGTTHIVDGAGKALSDEINKIAAENNDGVKGQPLDSSAAAFWQRMGWTQSEEFGGGSMYDPEVHWGMSADKVKQLVEGTK